MTETKRKPKPIPLRQKIDPRLKMIGEQASALYEELDECGDDKVRDLATDVLNISLALEVAVAAAAGISEEYVKPKKDRWLLPEGALVQVRVDLEGRYAVAPGVPLKLEKYGKFCQCEVGGTRYMIERAHLELVSEVVSIDSVDEQRDTAAN